MMRVQLSLYAAIFSPNEQVVTDQLSSPDLSRTRENIHLEPEENSQDGVCH